VPTLINLSRARLASGNPDDAEALLRRALSHDQANIEARIGLADIARRRGKTDEAKHWLEEIRADDPKAVASRLLLARLYLTDRETAKASKVLAEALAAAPNRSDVLVAAGALQQDFGHHEQALGYYRKAADLEPQRPEHWLNVARAQAALGYQPAARESVERALSLNPASVDAVALAAMLDIMGGNKDVALKRVVELRARLPGDARAAMLEGDTRSTLGQYAEAAKAFADSSRLKPGTAAVIRQTQARQLAGMQDPRAPLREWLRQHPDDLPARAMNAVLLDQGGMADQAIAEYERVLAAGRPDAVMSNNLAWRYFEKGDPRAEAMARQARGLAPTNGAIADTLGWILVRKGAKDEGTRLLREAVKLAPQEPEIQLHLAEALVIADLDTEARDLLRKLLDSGKEFAGRSRAQELLRQAGG
jgi:putative PEP-CTERM system TPR-repeat lipoprotein